MRWLHCTVAIAALAVGAAPGARTPSQAPSGAQAFTVFLNGTAVGAVEVSVERTAAGIVISGTSRIGPPLSAVVRSVEIRYDSDWKPLGYSLDAVIRDQPTTVRTTFSGGSAASDITQFDKSAKKSDTVAVDALILPNAFYGSYEALAARLAGATPGAELHGYVVPQADVVMKVTSVSAERIEAPGRSVATRHYVMTFTTPGALTGVNLWSDESGRLVRLSVPSQSLDIVRTELATTAARRELAPRAGDENVRIQGNGFVLGATVSKPPGTSQAGVSKLPAVVLVGGSGSSDRDESIASVPIYVQIAGAVADAGWLVVRYDRRGTGESGGRIEAATLGDYADDADAVVRYVERRKDVDRKRVAVVGHGDGAWTALLTASRDDSIAALGLLAGAGTTGAELTLELQQKALARLTISDAQKKDRIELQKRIQQAAITGSGWEGIPADMRNQADTPWFQSFLLFDPAKVMPRTKQPILILRGSLDAQVSAEQSEKLAALARARKGAAGKAVRATTLAGLNHLFVPAKTGEVEEYVTLTDRNVAKECLEALTAWLKSVFTAAGTK